MESPFDIAADLDTPVSAYMKLKPFGPRFLLESVESGERLARYSFIGLGEAVHRSSCIPTGSPINGKAEPPARERRRVAGDDARRARARADC